MEMLSRDERQRFLNYLPNMKISIKEWLLVDIRITEDPENNLTVKKAAETIYDVFRNKEGRIYICNDREILMVVHWGQITEPMVVAKEIASKLPDKSCKLNVQEPTSEGLTKLELLIGHQESVATPDANTRASRRENVILVADDDMYMRMLIKKGAQKIATIHEVANGTEVMAVYKNYIPDIVFLDIHLPGKDGMTLLKEILATDRLAYIIMVSADSSPENMKFTSYHGARGFLPKPFNKETLLEYIHKCPTIV